MSYNTDLFAFFDAMNNGDYGYVDKLEDDEVKSLSPFVLLMWVGGATSNQPIHTILTETYCASMVFRLNKHPRLLLKLFIAANEGIGKTRYKFRKNTINKESKHIRMVCKHFVCGLTEARQYIKLLSAADLAELEEIYEGVDL
jgi:hypothetical protein